MDNGLFSIGDVARVSGLSVSALRFYDREAVLIPVLVDPANGYRWYSPPQVRSAELIAVLRRVGLALPEIAKVLTLQGNGDVLRQVLSEHVARLEQGLASAKTLIGQIEQRWNTTEMDIRPHIISLDSLDLLKALSSVRFAIGVDKEFPGLRGIFLGADEGQLRIIASDRHRAAFYTIETDSDSTGFRIVLAESGLDGLLELLQEGGVVRLTYSSELKVTLGEKTLTCPLLNVDFPNFAQILKPVAGAATAEVDRDWLRLELRKNQNVEQRLIEVDYDGQLLLDSDTSYVSERALLLNANFLSEAVEAVSGDQLSLELNGPIAPLAIRDVNNPNSFSVIMPMLRDQP